MGKYDFELDLSGQNSLLLILEQIKPGSIILEFGPANGRLTKYLKQVLHCKMYLVELDEAAGKEALQYAEDLVVGDAEKYELWLERYRTIKFDYILFPDILEHLRNPKQLLINSKLLLKENGSMLMSVPNMAHNSVMINLLNNNLEYSSTGLLDNTHIYFFTKNGLEKMLRQSGLHVSKRFATYQKTELSEVLANKKDVAGISENYWKNRPYGEVYQYVYEVKKNIEYLDEVENYLQTTISSPQIQVYLKNEDGYSEERIINKKLQNCEGINFYQYTFQNVQMEVRIDPLDTCGIVVLKRLETEASDCKLDILSDNADYKIGNYYFFHHEDPQFYIGDKNGKGFEHLNIEFECLTAGDLELVNKIRKVLQEELILEKTKLQEKLAEEETKFNERVQTIYETSEKRTQMYIAEKELENNKLQESIQEEYTLRLREQKIKAEKAEMENEELKTKLKENENYINAFKNLLVEKEKKYCEVQAVLDAVYNSKTWRLNQFFAKLMKRK